MNRAIWVVLALALLGAAPAATPLVTGSVRDAAGRPIAGATISAQTASGNVVNSTSDPDGTFALQGDGIASVAIRCRFCQPLTATVAADGTVVAVVRRYDALAFAGPSPDDVADLPYERVESDLALTPFTVLENSSSIVPGPQLGDRVLQSGGGLIVDDDLPSYDISTGISPFLTIPARYVQSVASTPQSDAFRSGDLADDGTFFLDPRNDGADASVSAGNGLAARVGTSTGSLAGSGGSSGDAFEQSRQADAEFDAPIPQGNLEFSALSGDGTERPDYDDDIASAFSGAHLGIERTQSLTERVDAYVDRGSYAATYLGGGLQSTWSDTGATLTLAGNSTIAPFAILGTRNSAGEYDARPLGIPQVGASLEQTQGVVGVHAGGTNYDAVLAFGGYDVAYAGGSYGSSTAASSFLGTPSMQLHFAPDGHWSFDLSSSGSFRLPTFAQRYGDGSPSTSLTVDRDSTLESTVGYTDASRVSFAATALIRNTIGYDNGRIAAIGESIAWQIAPDLSLRTWWMHDAPNQTRYDYGLQFGAVTQTFSVGSTWLSYASPSGLRADLIWRQDLLNYLPDAHLDESISAPLAPHLRWFVGSERREGARDVDAGVRFATP